MWLILFNHVFEHILKTLFFDECSSGFLKTLFSSNVAVGNYLKTLFSLNIEVFHSWKRFFSSNVTVVNCWKQEFWTELEFRVTTFPALIEIWRFYSKNSDIILEKTLFSLEYSSSWYWWWTFVTWFWQWMNYIHSSVGFFRKSYNFCSNNMAPRDFALGNSNFDSCIQYILA